jgi:3'-5' exonuclease
MLSPTYRVYIPDNPERAEIMAHALLMSDGTTFGLDTERDSRTQIVELIQVATTTEVYLFQVDRVGLPNSLRKLLESVTKIKVGVDITGDARYIRTSLGVEMRGCIEIQSIAITVGIGAMSLEDLATSLVPGYPGKRIKGGPSPVHRWSHTLTPEQIEYAANDAWYSLMVYRQLVPARRGSNPHSGTPPNSPLPESIPPPCFGGTSESISPELQAYYVWISNHIRTTPMQREKVVNLVVNSYKPWRKIMTEAERRQKARSCIQELVQRGKIVQDAFGDRIALTSSSGIDTSLPFSIPRPLTPDPRTGTGQDRGRAEGWTGTGQDRGRAEGWTVPVQDLPPDFLPRLIGLTEPAAINVICNSYGPLSKLAMTERKVVACSMLARIVMTKRVRWDMGKLVPA